VGNWKKECCFLGFVSHRSMEFQQAASLPKPANNQKQSSFRDVVPISLCSRKFTQGYGLEDWLRIKTYYAIKRTLEGRSGETS